MDIEERSRAGTVSWTIAITTLVVIAGAQVYQIAMVAAAAGSIDLPEREYVHRLAWLALAVLSVDVVVLFWLAMRFFSRGGRRRETEPVDTPYVDAWAAAGERFTLDEAPGDDDETPDESDTLEE